MLTWRWKVRLSFYGTTIQKDHEKYEETKTWKSPSNGGVMSVVLNSFNMPLSGAATSYKRLAVGAYCQLQDADLGQQRNFHPTPYSGVPPRNHVSLLSPKNYPLPALVFWLFLGEEGISSLPQNPVQGCVST
jgi:hypothetical protein